MRCSPAFLLVLLLAIVSRVGASPPLRYTLQDLGPVLTVGAVNATGDAAGSISAASHEQAPARLRPGTMQQLAETGLATGVTGVYTVGYTSHDLINQEAFVTSPTTGMQLLGLLTPGFGSAATAINTRRTVVGYGSRDVDTTLAIVWSITGAHWTLPVPPNRSAFAFAVSPRGRIVGDVDSTDDGTAFHAALWWGGTLQDLGTLGGASSQAFGVSDAPLVVGWSHTSMTTRDRAAMTWTPARGMLPLPALDGTFRSCVAVAVNADSLIVGTCAPWSLERAHAVRWSAGRVEDLATLIPAQGWTLETATGLNEAGQIVGVGWLGSAQHGYLLTPVPDRRRR